MAQSETLKGDVNADGVVDVADIAAVIKIMVQDAEDEPGETKYYWYAGWTIPTAENIATIINEVDGKSGQYIGTQLGTYTETTPLAIVDYYDTNYSHLHYKVTYNSLN
jgi:hypothetical protein